MNKPTKPKKKTHKKKTIIITNVTNTANSTQIAIGKLYIGYTS